MLTRLLCLALLAGCTAALPADQTRGQDDDEELYRLPKGFLFGAGISAYQMEGAWNQDGKGVNVYDAAYHEMNDTAGDVACDSYNRYREDVALAAEMKFNVFRFSISWARIFPNGRRTYMEQRGVQHYHDVIDELLKYGIQPLVTIHHFDYPQVLQDEFKGWYSEKMIDIFVDFADFIFNEYGSKVKHWVTINEPNMHCEITPTATNPESDYYTCIHHEILAHAKAYRIYQQKYAAKQKGVVGIGAISFFSRPNSTEHDDIAATQRNNMFDLGYMVHPLVFGDYPVIMRTVLGSSLPTFTEEQTRLLRGAIDFVGVNSYSGFVIADAVKRETPDVEVPRPLSARGSGHQRRRDIGPIGPLKGPPRGLNVTMVRFNRDPTDPSDAWMLADLSVWVKETYGNRIGIFITENGAYPGEESLDDYYVKVPVISVLLRNLMKVANQYDLNVMGYTYWPFIDGYEFSQGLRSYHGIVKVDFDNGSLNRTLRKSSEFFKTVATTRSVPYVKMLNNSGNLHSASLSVLLGILAATVWSL